MLTKEKAFDLQDDEDLMIIQQKYEQQEKRLNDIKENTEMKNETSTSNSMTIHLQDAQITHLMARLYKPFA